MYSAVDRVESVDDPLGSALGYTYCKLDKTYYEYCIYDYLYYVKKVYNYKYLAYGIGRNIAFMTSTIINVEN